MTETVQSPPKKRRIMMFVFACVLAIVAVKALDVLMSYAKPNEAGRQASAYLLIRAYDERNRTAVVYFQRRDSATAELIDKDAAEAREIGESIRKHISVSNPDDATREKFVKYMELQCSITKRVQNAVRATRDTMRASPVWRKASYSHDSYNAAVKADTSLLDPLFGSGKLVAKECAK